MTFVELVRVAVEHELAQAEDDTQRAHLQAVGAVLAHRAELEDTRDARLRPGLPGLVDAHLPELGPSASAGQEEAAASAMDWLGREVPTTVTAEAVADHLAALGRAGRVRSVRQLSGGFSKTTLLVALDEGEVVLRQVRPGRDGSGLLSELDVVRFAWERGVPAPEPLWSVAEDNALGGPYFATRRVRGSNLGDVFGPRPGLDPQVAHGLARALGALHALDPREVPRTPLSPMADRDDVLARITEQEEQVRLAAEPDGGGAAELHALLFTWLREQLPDRLPPPVLLHGDPGFHNLMVDGGEVQALLDWERARLGDPAQDLAYVRPHVDGVLPWAEFVSSYVEAGGPSPVEDRMRYYAAWHDTWRFAGAYRGRARLLGGSRSVLDAVLGLLHAPRFLHAAVCEVTR